jgi:hypothetical protein
MAVQVAHPYFPPLQLLAEAAAVAIQAFQLDKMAVQAEVAVIQLGLVALRREELALAVKVLQVAALLAQAVLLAVVVQEPLVAILHFQARRFWAEMAA